MEMSATNNSQEYQVKVHYCLIVRNKIGGGGNHRFYGHGGGFIIYNRDHGWTSKTLKLEVDHCTISENVLTASWGAEAFLSVIGGLGDKENRIQLSNSIIYGNKTPAITNHEVKAGAHASSIWNCKNAYSLSFYPPAKNSSLNGVGLMRVNPLLQKNFRLNPGSPAIDSGNPKNTQDPDGTRTDMGCFYFHKRRVVIHPNPRPGRHSKPNLPPLPFVPPRGPFQDEKNPVR